MGDAEFKAGPPGGNESDKTTQKHAKSKEKARSLVQRLVALIWMGIDGYLLYAFCYVVVWQHVRLRNRSAAIAILVIFCFVNFYVFVSFFALHLWGPGKVTENYSKVSDADPDAAFICDEHGYSLYCSYCKHIKPNRTHHASFTDTCVPVMDHFCPWVGTVIGQGNVKFFLQFSWSACAGIVIILVTLFIYQHDQAPHINGNSIALYAISGIVFGFLFLLIAQHTLYVMLAQTTLEHMGYRRNNIPYINLLWRDDQRRVVQPTKKDITMPRPSPFDRGIWQNILFVMGPIYTWLLPIREPLTEPQFGAKFLDKMKERITE